MRQPGYMTAIHWHRRMARIIRVARAALDGPAISVSGRQILLGTLLN